MALLQIRSLLGSSFRRGWPAAGVVLEQAYIWSSLQQILGSGGRFILDLFPSPFRFLVMEWYSRGGIDP
jgi:hypothetical protein